MGSCQYAWIRAALDTYTSLTVLNSSLEARGFGSPDSLDSLVGGGGGPCWVLRDLRMSKNRRTYSVVTTCADGWFAGNVRPRVGEQGSVGVASKASSGGCMRAGAVRATTRGYLHVH
jgi:hypothetical protein